MNAKEGMELAVHISAWLHAIKKYTSLSVIEYIELDIARIKASAKKDDR